WSDPSGIIRPVQQGLSLFRPAIKRTRRTIFPDLREVTTHRAPAFDLALVVNTSAPHVVAAVPLKPTARIFVIDPTFFLPNCYRLRRLYFEEVELGIVTIGIELCVLEPRCRKLLSSISHVLATENAECQHFLRSQFRFEI